VTAVLRAARGGLGGRRLQAVIICLVVLAATAAATLALGMLADAHSPFDHAFAVQRGADDTVTVDASLATGARLAATTRLAGVTAAAGPFAETTVTAQLAVPGLSGSQSVPLQITGRASPGGPVDDLTLIAGHWPTGDSQLVLSEDAPGNIGSTFTVGSHQLTVVGVANSVTNTAQAWVLPAELTALAGKGGAAQAEMLYRFADAGTSAALAADVAAVRAALPRGAVLDASSYLVVRQSEQSNIAPWVPFIIAFGVLALAISILIVINVVGGAVIAGTTRIGVLKSIGFTPAQVVTSYVLLVAVPAILGCVIGAICGNLLAVPLLSQNAQVYQVGGLGVPVWVDVAVPLAVLALTAAGAVPPALRAGRMSAVQAMATGRAPRPKHGYAAHRALARLASLPRAVTLGLAAPAARPARTLVTGVAVLFGAAAVTFGFGLGTSLTRAYADISQSALPVRVLAPPAGLPGPAAPGGQDHVFKPKGGGIRVIGPSGGPRGLTAVQQRTIVAALAAEPGTLHYVSVGHDQLNPPGLASGLNVTAYGGNPAWSGLALISGRWYSGADEADVNTLFLTDTGTSVGSTYALSSGGHTVTVRIVGEVFRPGNDAEMFFSPATFAAVDPGAGQQEYDVSLKPGTNPQAYANAISAKLGNAYYTDATRGGGGVFAAVETLVTMLTILIMVVAGLGVLNTVALQIRERAHDIGVFKSVGMTPRQTLAMILCSVAVVGLVAGIIAVPAGMYLHDGVVPTMAHAANSGIPASLLTAYLPWEVVALALAGLAIAIAGALGPASWAAGTRTAFALRAE
jgi:putative ABC transport system permease protein